MSRFSYPIKRELYKAQADFTAESNFVLSGVMGTLANIADATGKMLNWNGYPEAAVELETFRKALNQHIDFEISMESLSADDEEKARKIITDLTELSNRL